MCFNLPSGASVRLCLFRRNTASVGDTLPPRKITSVPTSAPRRRDLSIFIPEHALELRNEGLNSKKSGGFIGFSIAPLW